MSIGLQLRHSTVGSEWVNMEYSTVNVQTCETISYIKVYNLYGVSAKMKQNSKTKKKRKKKCTCGKKMWKHSGKLLNQP